MFNSKWNENHKLNWNPQLELNSDGFSGFQLQLIKEVKELLESNSIKYAEEVSQHVDLAEDDKVVKLITLSLNDSTESKIWIYHNMAEYELNKKHHIYEEWGYLSPFELQEKYIKSLREILKTH